MEKFDLNEQLRKDVIASIERLFPDNETAAVGDMVSFTYKGGRKVRGVVKQINTNAVVLTLETDYIGKNVEWFAGEDKDFTLKECKNFRIINNGIQNKHK